MDWWDWVSIVAGVAGAAAGVWGIVISIKQTNKMRKLSSMYKEKCSIRYKDLAETTTILSEKILASCEIVNEICIRKTVPCTILSANIDVAMAQTRQLLRFCKRLDEEYVAEFDEPIDQLVSQQLDEIRCRCVEQPAHELVQPVP
jgi:hypothetical protein